MIMMMSPGFCSAFLVCAAARRSACNVLKFNGQRIRWVFVSHALTWQVPWMLDPTKQLELDTVDTVDTGHPQKTDLHDRGELCFTVRLSNLEGRIGWIWLACPSVHWHGDVFLARLSCFSHVQHELGLSLTPFRRMKTHQSCKFLKPIAWLRDIQRWLQLRRLCFALIRATFGTINF